MKKINSLQPSQPPFRLFTRYVFILVLAFGLAALLAVGQVRINFIDRALQKIDLPAKTLLPETFGNENVLFNHAVEAKDRPKNIYHLMFEALTDLHFDDIRSLFGSELPGFTIYNTKIFVAGEGLDYTNLPQDNPPPPEFDLQIPEPVPAPKKPENEAKLKKTVLIYHTHYWEAYKPVNHGKDSSMDPKLGVFQAGEKVGQVLSKRGIGSIHETKRNWTAGANAYQKSRIAVQAALKNNTSLKYLIDIHRDSLGRSKTTMTLNGVSYARISLIIGEANPDYSANLYLAKQIKERMDKRNPGLVRGIVGKTKFEGNGIYNQDLSKTAMLIEIGGVDNTMDEVERSSAAFAEALSDYIQTENK